MRKRTENEAKRFVNRIIDAMCLYHVPFETLAYREASLLQERIVELQHKDRLPDLLLTLEHPPTITVGVSGGFSDLNVSESWLQSQGIELVWTRRGGKTTYHGPGQLVVYPLIHLRKLGLRPRRYLGILEETVIRILGEWGVQSSRIDGRPGVWVEDRKIASIGIRLRAGRTMHGLAVNLQMDLTPFSFFVPCGMPQVVMTSLDRETGQMVDGRRIPRRFAQCFAEQLGTRLQPLPPTELTRRMDQGFKEREPSIPDSGILITK